MNGHRATTRRSRDRLSSSASRASWLPGPLALVGVGDLGVGEDDRVAGEAVGGDPDQRVAVVQLVAGVGRVVGNEKSHKARA